MFLGSYQSTVTKLVLHFPLLAVISAFFLFYTYHSLSIQMYFHGFSFITLKKYFTLNTRYVNRIVKYL